MYICAKGRQIMIHLSVYSAYFLYSVYKLVLQWRNNLDLSDINLFLFNPDLISKLSEKRKNETAFENEIIPHACTGSVVITNSFNVPFPFVCRFLAGI